MRLPALAVVGLGVLACFNACGSSDKKKVEREEAGAGGDAPEGAAGSSEAGASPSAGDGGTPGSAGESSGGTDSSTAGAGGDGTPPVTGPVTVDGVVVARNEQPIAGITIEIQGESVVTGVDGRFHIEAIAPYDIVVSGDSIGGDLYYEAYLGVTRSDPKLYRSFVEEDRSGGAEGTISGGEGFPQPADHVTHVTFGGPVLATFSNTLPATSDGTYVSSGDPTWLNTDTLTGRLFAIQVESTTQALTGIGSNAFTLVDGESTTGGDVAMLTPVMHDFTLNLGAPNGLAINSAMVGFSVYNQTRMDPDEQEVFSLPGEIPDEIGVAVVVSAGTFPGGTSGSTHLLPGDATSLDIELLAPPTITSPGETVAQIDEDTPLSYTRPTGTVAALNFSYMVGDAETGFSTFIIVYTDDSTVNMKRLEAANVPMAPGDMDWSVSADGDATTLDALLAPDEDRWPIGHMSTSAQRSLFNGQAVPLP